MIRMIPATLLCALLLTACGEAGLAPQQACSLAIEHVALVPMNTDQVVHDQSVRIAGGRILAIGRTGSPAPGCDRTIDGRGKYLAPGLNDMHMHVESWMFQQVFGTASGPVPFEDVLYLYLSHGVTGVRVMSGAPDLLAFRDSTHGPAPRLAIGSPMLSGDPPILPEPITRVVVSPRQAADAVESYANEGYDFIKVRENLDQPVLRAVMDAARRHGMDVDGHLPRVADPLAFGRRGIAHVDELALLVDDPARDPAVLANKVLACGCYVTTTLSVEKSVAAQLRDYEGLAARPEARFVHPLMRRALWDKEHNPYLAEAQDPAFFDHLLDTGQAVVRELHRRGVPILAGTDALVPMIIPGESLHDELALLVAADLSPYDAISAATRTPSRLFARFGDLGVIEPGRTANLVLVSKNPLQDVAALRRPDAVIIGGQYLDRSTLDRRLEEIARSFAAQ